MNSMQSKIHAIRPDTIQYFLLHSGWKKEDFDAKFSAFIAPADQNGSQVKLFLPLKTDSADFAQRLQEAISAISLVQNEEFDEILSKLSKPNQDVLKLRLLVHDSDSIPFDLANNVISNLRQLFYYGSASQEQPKPFFTGKSKAGSSFVNHCRFEQTYAGSFGFSIAVSMDSLMTPEITTNILPPDLTEETEVRPVERRIMERIYRGFTKTKLAETEKSALLLVDSYEDSFNGNMCHALSKIFNVGSSLEIECKINWSPLLQVKDRSFNTPVLLSKGCATYLKSAYKQMAKWEANKQTVIFVGNITESKWTDETAQPDKISLTRRVEMTGNDPHQKWNIVRVYLENSDYSLACKANGEKLLCSVEGELVQNGKFWIIENARNFKLVDTFPETHIIFTE